MVWELFVEKIAEVLALALTDKETEIIIRSFHTFTARIRELSNKNLLLLAKEKQLIRPHCQHNGNCRGNCLRGLIRSFASAYSVKWLVAVLQMSIKARKLDWAIIMRAFDSDTFKFSMFFSSFIAAYKAIQCLMRRLRDREDRWNSFVAGAVASLALLMDAKQRRRAIGLYLGTRAAQLAYLCGMKYHLLPSIPHGDTLLMAVCNAQIINSWMCYPENLAKSYYEWIYNLADLSYFYGRTDARIAAKCLTAYSLGYRPPEQVVGPLLRKSESLLHFNNPQAMHHGNDICALIHPTSLSCTKGALEYSGRCFPKALQMYLPLNAGIMLLFKHRLLRKQPQEWLKRLILGSTRSSLFITLFATIAWLPPCYSRSLTGGIELRLAHWINGFLSGASVLLETKPRRIELAMYCLPRALESFVAGLNIPKRSLLRILNVELWVFMAAMGALMSVYQHDPDCIPPSYHSILVRFFGIN